MDNYEGCIFVEAPNWCSTYRDGKCRGLEPVIIMCAVNFWQRPLTKGGRSKLLKLFREEIADNPHRKGPAGIRRHLRKELKESRIRMAALTEKWRIRDEKLVAAGQGKFVDGRFCWYKDQPDPETFKKDKALLLRWTGNVSGFLNEESPILGSGDDH